MRKIIAAATLTLTVLLATSQAPAQQAPKAAQPPLVHSVIVYLKKDTPPAKVEELVADCHNILGKIPTVRSIWVGRPAEKGSPQFAVKDFHLGLLMLFDNEEGLKTYADHPTHLKFVEKYMPIVEKLQVYDFSNQTK